MGRPLNKRNFGADQVGDQLQITADVGGGAGTGFIVKQKGSKRYIVSVNGTEGLCSLVTGAPGVGEMQITVGLDAGGTTTVAKLYSRVAILADGSKIAWNFSTSTVDGAVGASDAISIDISVQPVNDTTTTGAAGFAITAANADTYQWQVRKGSGSYADVVNSDPNITYTNATTASMTIAGATAAEDGWTYRCVMTAVDAPNVTSATASLTFGS